jgi:hypothetical protein
MVLRALETNPGGGRMSMIRETDTKAFAILCALPDYFKELREHLCDRADSEGVELLWNALDAIRMAKWESTR